MSQFYRCKYCFGDHPPSEGCVRASLLNGRPPDEVMQEPEKTWHNYAFDGHQFTVDGKLVVPDRVTILTNDSGETVYMIDGVSILTLGSTKPAEQSRLAYNFKSQPFQREVVDALNKEFGSVVVIQSASSMGKTESLAGFMDAKLKEIAATLGIPEEMLNKPQPEGTYSLTAKMMLLERERLAALRSWFAPGVAARQQQFMKDAARYLEGNDNERRHVVFDEATDFPKHQMGVNRKSGNGESFANEILAHGRARAKPGKKQKKTPVPYVNKYGTRR